MRKRSICIVTEESIPPIQRFSLTLKLAETLGAEMDVHLISLSSNPNCIPKNVHFHPLKIEGWSLFSLKKRIEANLKLVREICKVCRKNKVDLIYGWWPAVFFGAIICGKPFATDMPEFIEEMYRSFDQPFRRIMKYFLKCLQKLVARKSAAIMVESEIAAEAWVKRKIPREKLCCFPYGVETEIFQSASSDNVRTHYNIPQDAIVLMYHGDIGFDDGVDFLIKVVEKLDVWLLCVGSGPEHHMNYLKTIANAKTIFTGWIPYLKIPDFLAACDIYVAPFRSTFYTNTTFPLKQMESMAAGKPTICTKLQAFSKSVKQAYDIMLVEPDNSTELKSAILELIQNEHLRKSLGDNARKTAIEKFDWRFRVAVESKMLKDTIDRMVHRKL